MMELMARGGMRIGEVLKIRPVDVKDRKITLPDPKSGRERARGNAILALPQFYKFFRLSADIRSKIPILCSGASYFSKKVWIHFLNITS
jgi:hypothetical protein